jgi:hypothetical protein
MNKNQISFLLIFIGIILVYVDLFLRYKKNTNNNKIKEKVIYKYVPRTMREEWDEPVFPSDIFETMFSQKSQWIHSFNDYDSRAKKREVNQYFISQV